MTEAPTKNSGTSQPWKWMEDFGKFVSLITAALLVLSTAYDFSFLYALGLTFDELPSTLADHVRSAIVWAPQALIYLAAFVIYEMFMRRVEGGMSEEELIANSPTPRFTRTFRKSPRVLFVITITIAMGVNFLFFNSNHWLFIIALVAWGFIAPSVVNHARLGVKFSSTTGRLFVIVPIVVIWVASLGYGRGNIMMSATIPTWKVELKGRAGNEMRTLVGLRRFSTVALLVESGRNVSLVPADSIVRADALRDPDVDTPRICKWFGAYCKSPKEVQP